MSTCENEHLANMKITIFLIIGFTHIVFCCHQNYTDDSYPVCPFNLFRRKRALTDYTRWRANIESTPEFIVKILDEELNTPKTKTIVAVNIQPLTKGMEKVIIGGAMVSIPTPVATSVELLKDYTRFVPPTTVGTRIEGDFFLAPVQTPIPKTHKFIALLPQARHPQRDESPPASPQFLTRNAIIGARQYAPITPVGFTHRNTLGPLTPPTTQVADDYNYRKSIPELQRTLSHADIVIPTRTKSDIQTFDKLLPYGKDVHDIHDDHYVTRTTFQPAIVPQRTAFDYPSGQLAGAQISMSDAIASAEKSYADEKKNEGHDSDTGYNMMFYNYDDNDVTAKKKEKESDEAYDDKIKDRMQRTTEIEFTEAIQTDNTNISETHIDINESEDVEDEPNDDITGTAKSTTTSSTSIHIVMNHSMKDSLREKRRQVCNMIKLRQLDFNSPRTLPEIVSQLKTWADESPVAKWVDITDGNFTAMENPIYMMIVDDPSSGQIITAKQTVMIVAGIQGRDQHAVAAAMYVLYQLIERSEVHAGLLTKYRFWIIPVFNPDGYSYAMTFPHRREWSKNLRQNWDVCKGRESCLSCEMYGLRCTTQPCYGVNLDRNFEYQWISAEELRAEHPCGSLYAGLRQLSEAETRAFTQYLHDRHTPLFTFIAFKEGDVLGVMYPYSHTRKKRTFDQTYRQRASRAAAAAYSISGRPYVAGQTSEFLPLYAGGIEDWVDGHLGIDNTYTIMMFRPADTYDSKLITERVVHEAYAAMDTLVLQSVKVPASQPQVTLTKSKSSYEKITASITSTFLPFITVLHTCST